VSVFRRYKPPGPLKRKANPYPTRTYPFRQKISILVFAFFLLGGAALRFYPSLYNPLSSFLFEGTASFQRIFIYPFQQAHTFLKDSYTFINLKNEHAALVQENKDLKWKLQVLHPLQHENNVLRQQLNVSTPRPYMHRVARIVSSPYDGIHYFFLIAAGSDQGLTKDQAVVDPDGVLGRIEKVGHHVARVLLLNDVNSRVPVMTEGSHQKAILAGEGNFFPTLVYVTDIQKIKPGEKVVTSGVGGIFPPGLPVGYINDITGGKIHVRLLASYKNLEWVHILHPQSASFLQEVQTNLEEQ
jgi:rod shape-determining protein MreC